MDQINYSFNLSKAIFQNILLMIYILLSIIFILFPTITILKSKIELLLFFIFFFFWELGFFRILFVKSFNYEDSDLILLENTIKTIDIYSNEFLILFFQIIIINISIILFVKYLSRKIEEFKFSNEIIIKKRWFIISYIIILFLSIYLIKDSFLKIIFENVTGYSAITNFEGGGYFAHVFINRFVLMLLIFDLLISEKLKKYHILFTLIFVLYFLILGQRNELFGFIISLIIMLTYKLKNISFNKIGIISLLGLFSLRIIENYRSGNYIEDFTQLIVDSFKTILSPFLGAESIVPFYSIYATINFENSTSILNYFLWVLQSFGVYNFNIPTTYLIYKEALFNNESRGFAINILASLNIYSNWLLAPFLLMFFFLMLSFLIKFVMRFYKNKIFGYGTLTIIIFSIQGIILLARNGLEGLRPLIFHNYFLYPILLILFIKICNEYKTHY